MIPLKVKCAYSQELKERLRAIDGVEVIGASCVGCADIGCVCYRPVGWWVPEEVGMNRG